MKDFYGLLGVAPDATADQIKSAYRRKAAQYHPDRNPAPDAAAKFRDVQEAYELLTDPDKRKAYDENRRSSLLDDPLTAARELWAAYLRNLRA